MRHTRLDLLLLFGALSGFLWMFLAAAPLETLADAEGAIRADAGGPIRGNSDVAIEVYRFAASWRHGMAGNSALYMPGFFLLAVAAWIWGTSGSIRRLIVEGGVMLLAGLIVAWACADMSKADIVARFERSVRARIVAPWPAPPLRAVVQGLYTAAAWMSVVVACRRALARRVFLPLLIVPPVTLGLVLIRPWTVDEFVSLWLARAADGDAAAIASAVAIPIVAAILVSTEWPTQRVHTDRSARRTQADQ